MKSFLLDSIEHVFIINLKNRTDRKKSMIEKLKKIGLGLTKITFIEATNRTEESWSNALQEIFEINKIDPIEFIGSSYRKKIKSSKEKIRLKARGEIGVFFSHFRIWSIVSRMKYGSYLVLEDDARPTDILFDSSTDILFKKVIDARVPFLFLGYLFPDCNGSVLAPLTIKGLNNSLMSCFVETLHSYVITPSFGLLVRGSLVSDGAFSPLPIEDPVDHFVPNFLIEYQIPFYVYKKPLFDQDVSFVSDIQGTMDKNEEMFKQLRL